MILGTVISSITGIITSLFQDWWHHKLELDKESKRFDLDLKRKESGLVQNSNEVQQLEIQNQIASEQTNQVQIKEEANNENNIINASIDGGTIKMDLNSKLTNFANFLIAITRPVITFLLGGLIAFIQIYSLLFPDHFNNLSDQYFLIMESTFYLFDGTLSFWFLKRSSEKFNFRKVYGR